MDAPPEKREAAPVQQERPQTERSNDDLNITSPLNVVNKQPSGGGWVKLHRSLLDHPRFQNGDWLKVYLYLMLRATHKPHQMIFSGKLITMQPGQLITSRKSIASVCKLSESKANRILKKLKSEQLIEQVTSPVHQLISLVGWQESQKTEQPIEQRANNDRTASEQRPNTNNNDKNEEEWN